jgi:hypothetical protein
MVTTSSNLVAGKAIRGRGGDGNGRSGLKAKLAAGVAILGCAGAIAFGGLRPERAAPVQQPAVAPAAATLNTASDLGTDYDPYILNGSQRRYVPTASRAYQGWTGTCRAGSSDCLPEEDFPASPLAPVAQPTGASVTEDYRWAFGAAPAAPATIIGETPCATGGTAPCGLFAEQAGGGIAPSPLAGPQP